MIPAQRDGMIRDKHTGGEREYGRTAPRGGPSKRDAEKYTGIGWGKTPFPQVLHIAHVDDIRAA